MLDFLTPLFEAVLDAPPDGGAPEPAAPAVPDGGGQAPPAADPGAAEGTTPAAEPPAAPPPIDWASPDAQDAVQAALDAREQAALEAQQQAEQSQQQQGKFAGVEEALALLGVEPDQFREYLTSLNPMMAQAAEQFQQQQIMQWVDGQLKTLAPTHPDLLGDGVAKLAEFVDDDGQPLFNTDDVGLSNRNAVLFAASALQQAGVADHGQALTQAAQQVADRDTLIGKIAVERFKQELQAGGTAPNIPTGTGTGGISRLSGLEGGDELAVARRINSERTA